MKYCPSESITNMFNGLQFTKHFHVLPHLILTSTMCLLFYYTEEISKTQRNKVTNVSVSSSH